MRNLWHMKLKRFIASWSLLGVKRIMILYTTFALFSYSEVFSYVSCRPGSYLSLWKQHDWWKIERYKVIYIMLQIVKVKRVNYYLKGVIFISHQTTCLSLWKQHDSWKIERYKVIYILLQIVKEGRINLMEGCYLHITPNYTFVSVEAAWLLENWMVHLYKVITLCSE